MKKPYKRGLFTALSDWIDSIVDPNDKKTKFIENYPHKDGINNRWGKNDVIFGPIEIEIYHQCRLLDKQNNYANLQLNKIELTVDVVQYQRVMNFLIKEFLYQDSKNFDKANFAQLIDKKIFSLDIYQNREVKTNPNIELIIHTRQGDHGHLLGDAKIHIYETKIELGLPSVHATSPQYDSSDNDYDDSSSKKVQIRIYDEKGDRRIQNISTFPAILGKNGEIGLYGKYVSREHIELDFNANDELVVKNISETNPIFVNAKILNEAEEIDGQPGKYIISESIIDINDKIHIGKIVNNEQENRLYPIVEIKKVRVPYDTPANSSSREYRRAGPTPKVIDDINTTPYPEVPITAYPEVPPTQIAEQPLFKLLINIHGIEQSEPITRSQLPCLIGRLGRLLEGSRHQKLITIPSYYQGGTSTVSREHLVIEDFQDGVAQIKVLGKNGCFINNVKQPSIFDLNPYCELQLGVDSPPVTIKLVED